MSSHEWSRVMRTLWLLNTVEVDLCRLGIPLMRIPASMRDLADALSTMSEEDRRLIEDELCRAHATLAQVVGELSAGLTEIEKVLLIQSPTSPGAQAQPSSTDNISESTRSVVWQKS